MPDKKVTYVISLEDLYSKNIKKADKNTNNFENSVKSVGKSMLGLAAGAASFAAIGSVIGKSIVKIADFEEQVSNLSAITGLVGEDLDFLSNKAIELGGATTKSSIDTIKAFKLIASAKPELLENASALAAVTKEAIILSEASGLQLPDAARNLAETLNQFSAGADQASRFINVLAAGSKLSAAEIPEVALAIKEFGVNAKDANISVEQSVALVETLAEKGIKGSRAGIQLKNVLLKLAASTDKKINPEFVDLSTALDNLAKKQLSTAELTKMFGTENIIAAKILTQNRARVDDLSEALTGTNIAYEQASINTDNLNSDVKRLTSAWEKFVLNLNQGEGAISNALRRSTQSLTGFIEKVDFLNKTEEERSKSAAENAKDRLREDLAGEKNEDKIKSAIIKKIGLNRKLRQEEAERLKELNKFRNTIAGSIITGRQEGIRERRLLESLIKGRAAANEELEKLITDPSKFNKFLKSLEAGAQIKTTVDSAVSAVPGAELKEAVTTIKAAAPKTFNINIAGDLVGEFNLKSETIREGATESRNIVTEELSLALADLQAVAQ